MTKWVIDKSGSSVATFDGRVNRNSSNHRILMLEDGRADIREIEIQTDRRVTHIRAQYWDKGRDYERSWTQEIVDPDYTDGDPQVEEELYLPGVTRRAEAVRQCRYVINTARLRPYLYEIGIGLGNFDLLPFDIITVYSDSPNLSGQEMQVLSVIFDNALTGRLICREYDSDAYTDTSDTLPARDPLLTRTQALKRASVIPKGAGSLTIVEVEV
jgi:hypothetical protein